jgi:uncharacterized protein (TIGR00297 family)
VEVSPLAHLTVVVPAAGLLAAAAWQRRWLTWDGALAAWAVGGAAWGFGGPRWVGVLGVFFLTSTALTRIGRDRKTQPEHTRGGRNAAQVLCTGGVGAGLALLWGGVPVPDPLQVVLYPAFLGSVAAATADTWATEIGMLASGPPRLITTWQPVPPGTSGGVSLLGTAAGATGAALAAAAGVWEHPAMVAAVASAGVLAMLADSLLGATAQAVYRHANGQLTEEPGAGALVRGLAWLTNPLVNLVATLVGALLAALFAALLPR